MPRTLYFTTADPATMRDDDLAASIAQHEHRIASGHVEGDIKGYREAFVDPLLREQIKRLREDGRDLGVPNSRPWLRRLKDTN